MHYLNETTERSNFNQIGKNPLSALSSAMPVCTTVSQINGKIADL